MYLDQVPRDVQQLHHQRVGSRHRAAAVMFFSIDTVNMEDLYS